MRTRTTLLRLLMIALMSTGFAASAAPQSSSIAVTASVKNAVAISQKTFVFQIPVNINDSITTQASASFIVRANASDVRYDLSLTVDAENLDATHNVYLLTNDAGSKVPFEVRLTSQAISVDPAAGQEASGLSGTNLRGTQYQITLTEATALQSLYAASPAGIYTITITAHIGLSN